MSSAGPWNLTRRTRRHANRATNFAQLIDPEHLLHGYHRVSETGGQSPGLDGVRYANISDTEAARICQQISSAVQERTYRPHATRSVRIPRAGGRFRELRLRGIFDRALAAAVNEVLTPAIDPQLLPCCFGYRRRRSTLHMLAALERDMRDTGRRVIVTDDISNAFPSVRIEDVLIDFRQIIHDDKLFWLVETIIRGHDGGLHTLGLDQGCPISPGALNLRLNFCLDRPFTAGPGSPPLYRWADNIALLCRGVTDGRDDHRRIGELLRSAGFNLKGEGPPSNLARQGAKSCYLGTRLAGETTA